MTAIWEYDKRSVNGANFVYFGMFCRGAQGAREKALIAYSAQVVKALGILQGPSHMEVMYNETTGPCLVEVGSRCHGGEGTWLPVAEECLGYSQLDANLNAFLRPDRFDALPFEPGKGDVIIITLVMCLINKHIFTDFCLSVFLQRQPNSDARLSL